MTDRRRWLSTVLPLLVTAGVIGALAVLQFRWLGDLASAARDRMERDLRVAVQAAVAEVELETGRLLVALDAAAGDSVARRRGWEAWAGAAGGLAGLYPAVPGSPPVPDSAFVADALLPLLARRIEALAELPVTLALHRVDPDGRTHHLAGADSIAGEADVDTPLPLVGRGRRIIFVDEGPAVPGRGDGGRAVEWTAADPTTAVALAPAGGWRLRAWHGAGSLERAATLIRRRNLVTGFGLMGLLVASATLSIAAFRRNERLAVDRATILAGISHEVRTPLAVIRSAADNLGSGIVTEAAAVRDYGRLIEREAARLEHSVEGALAFARAAAAGDAGSGVVDLRALAEAARAACGDPDRIVVEGSPAPCRGDGSALGLAVRNLLANALQYTGGGSPVSVVAAHRGDVVELAVMDRGPGIADAERRRIFAPFVRGSAGEASGRAGLGLGLALASRVATLHRGRLDCEAREGGGAIFRLVVPVG